MLLTFAYLFLCSSCATSKIETKQTCIEKCFKEKRARYGNVFRVEIQGDAKCLLECERKNFIKP